MYGSVMRFGCSKGRCLLKGFKSLFFSLYSVKLLAKHGTPRLRIL